MFDRLNTPPTCGTNRDLVIGMVQLSEPFIAEERGKSAHFAIFKALRPRGQHLHSRNVLCLRACEADAGVDRKIEGIPQKKKPI